jgi:hypothetical protein
MSKQEKRSPSRGKGRNRGRKHRATGARAVTKPNAKAWANKTLDGHVFDYSTKNATDQMATTWENIIVLAGSTMGEDICNELRNKRPVTIPRLTIPQSAQDQHDDEVDRRNTQKTRLKDDQSKALAAIESAIADTYKKEKKELAALEVQKAELQNQIEQLSHEIQNPPPVELREAWAEKAKYNGEWKAYNLQQAKLTFHQGQAHSTIIGQCTQVLKDKMKHDPTYTSVMDSCNPLKLKKLIEKIILSQSDYQYPYAFNYLLWTGQGTGWISSARAVECPILQEVQYKSGRGQGGWYHKDT